MSNVSTDLAIRDGQGTFDAKQVAALKQLGVAEAGNADLAIFFHQCVRTGLDPFLRQIYMIGRKTNENGEYKVKQTIQTGIDGFRLIARRAVDKRKEALGYAEPLWCGEDGQWREVWLSTEPPAAAKVTVYRDGQPFPAVAVFREFAQRKSGGALNSQWSSRPAHMIAKCAEALALRMAFPQDLSGLYTTDETGDLEPGDLMEQSAPSNGSAGTRQMSRKSKDEPVAEIEAPQAEPAAEPVEAEVVAEVDAATWPEVMA